MTDPLMVAARALRDVEPARPAEVRGTRNRILGEVRERRRRRVTRWGLGVPLAALFIGSVALAATQPEARKWTWKTASSLGLHRALTEPFRSISRETRGGSSGQGLSVARERAVSQVAQIAGGWVSVSAVPEVPSGSAPPVADDSATIRELELYGRAHRAHFVARDAARALGDWEAYLAEVPQGRFASEARYNRALCLVRLARHAEARRALLPFAEGATGGYRQQEARRLLSSLGEGVDASP